MITEPLRVWGVPDCLDVQKRNELLSYLSHYYFRFCVTHRQTSTELILAKVLISSKLKSL